LRKQVLIAWPNDIGIPRYRSQHGPAEKKLLVTAHLSKETGVMAVRQICATLICG